MDQRSLHPLDCITRQSSLSLLELLIPFVDYPMKLPLALFIKAQEILCILQAFSSPESIRRYGLHNTSKDLTDLLCQYTGISPDLMKMLFTMSAQNKDFTDILSSLNLSGMPDSSFSGSETAKEHTTASPPPESPSECLSSDPDVFSGIWDILAQYDLEQAAHMQPEDPESPLPVPEPDSTGTDTS